MLVIEPVDHLLSKTGLSNLRRDFLMQTDSAEDLGLYVFHAMTTVGDVDDFRHFLPRILELALSTEFPVAREVVPGKLRYAKWTEWPAGESQAVRAYLAELWRTTLDHISWLGQVTARRQLRPTLRGLSAMSAGLWKGPNHPTHFGKSLQTNGSRSRHGSSDTNAPAIRASGFA